MKRYIFLLFVLFTEILFSQNYGNICTSGLTFYKDSSGNIKAFRLDSTYLPGNNDTIFVSYRTIWDTLSYSCYDTTNGSVLGLKVYKKHDGWFYFFNRKQDTIKMNSQASLNQTWKFCNLPSNHYIQAKVTAIISDSVLGTTDQVKIITLQAKDNQNNNISHILNNKFIKLSQHYGLTKMLYVYYIPSDTTMYFLEGKSSPQMGLQDMTWREVFDFNVGDVFHYTGYEGPQFTHYELIENILSKTMSQDSTSVNYTIECCQKVIWNPPYYSHDTITEIYDTSTCLWCYPSIGLPQELKLDIYGEADLFDANLSIYNQRFSKIIMPEYYQSLSDCWQYGWFEIGYTYKYTRGLGLTYYLFNDTGDFDFLKKELVYYERGNEIWGTPVSLDCSTLLGTGQTKSNKNPVVRVIPNPVVTQAEIHISGYNQIDNLNIVLYDYTGKKVLSEKMNSNPFIFNRGDLVAGLYLLTVYDKNDFILGREKIIFK